MALVHKVHIQGDEYHSHITISIIISSCSKVQYPNLHIPKKNGSQTLLSSGVWLGKDW